MGARLWKFPLFPHLSGGWGETLLERGTQVPGMFLKVRIQVSLMLPALPPKTLLGVALFVRKSQNSLALASSSFRQYAPTICSYQQASVVSYICHSSSHNGDLTSAIPSAWKIVPSPSSWGKVSSPSRYQPSAYLSLKAPPLDQVFPLWVLIATSPLSPCNSIFVGVIMWLMPASLWRGKLCEGKVLAYWFTPFW